MLRRSCYLVLGVVLVLGIMVGGGTQAAAGPIKLTYSNFFPPTHIQSKLAEAWCKEVEKRTNGAVVVEYFPGQTLTKAQTDLRRHGSGHVRSGVLPVRLYQGEVPLDRGGRSAPGLHFRQGSHQGGQRCGREVQSQGVVRRQGDVSSRPRAGRASHQEKSGSRTWPI